VTIGRYLEGIALAVVCLVPLGIAARRLRRRIAPWCDGLVATIADGVTLLGLLILTLEAVGVIGVLDRIGVVCGSLIVAGAAWFGAAGAAGTEPARARPLAAARARADRRPLIAVALTGVAVVAAAWLGWTIFAYRHGMETVDTLWYHLPFAARFVQLGNIRHLQYFDGDSITAFYPANSELLHAFGLVVFGNDLISPVLDLCWGAAALCCAWAIGRPWGREPHCLLACLPVLASPGLVDTQPGGAYDDIVCLALVLASIALIVNGRDADGRLPVGASALAAVAAGLGIGTKYTVIVPAIVLGAGTVALLARPERARHAAVWAAGLIALGGYWYARNWVIVGNPLPSLSIHLGPLSPPSPHTEATYTIWQYLTDGRAWSDYFIPGWRQSLGLAWWALIAASIVGGAIALTRRRDPRLVLLGALAMLGWLAFLLTPQLLGIPGRPIFFSANVRYGTVPLALGLLALVLTPPTGWARIATVVAGAYAAALVATVLDPGVWRSGIDVKPFAPALHGGPALAAAVVAAVLLVAAQAWLWVVPRLTARGPRPPRPVLALAGASGVAAAIALGAVVGDAYARDRYRASPPLPAVYAWAQRAGSARIGIYGLPLQYPLTGPHAANHVQYIGTPRPDHGFSPPSDCRQWRTAVNEGRYDYVLVTPTTFAAVTGSPELRWTATSRHARAILRQYNGATEIGVLFRITGTLAPATCPR
jgi:hypothetical protein